MLNRRESVDMPWESQGRNADLESTLLTVHKSTKVDIDSGSTGTTLEYFEFSSAKAVIPSKEF